VGIVELNTVEFCETRKVVTMRFFVLPYHVLQRCGREEILLAYPQDFSVVGGIVGIEHPRYIFGFVPFCECLVELLAVEKAVVELLRRLGLPQAECIDVGSPVTDYGEVVGNGNHIHIVEMDRYPFLVPLYKEGIPFLLPCIGSFLLEPVFEGLSEKAVPVQDPVSLDGKIVGSARIEKARGKTAESPVSESGIVFQLEDLRDIFPV